MSEFIIVAVIALAVTFPAVVFIPRARQSPAFDRVLWGATWLVSILGAYAAPSYLTDAALNGWQLGQVAVIPTLIGAAAGALSINAALVLLDRFSSPFEEGQDPGAWTEDVESQDAEGRTDADDPQS